MSAPSSALAADRRAPLAALLSFVFPGLGQAYNGQTGLAWLLASPVFVMVAGTAMILAAAGGGVLVRLLDIRFLIGLIVLDVAFLAWRLVAIAQAHGWRERFSIRHWTGWATVGIVAVTIAMHALPAWYAAKAIDTLNAVALGGSSGGFNSAGFGDVPGFTRLPAPSTQPNVERGERVNILLVGIDAAPNRTTQLTDTMLVVSLDTGGARSAMVSVPRDLYGAPLPDGRTFNAKLNSLMAHAATRPEEFPLGGVGTLKASIGSLLGVDIHYFGAINLLGFKQAVDSIGGVDINVERAIRDPAYRDEFGVRVGFFAEPGPEHMDGRRALGFVRSRKGVGDNDFTRADRQQQLLTALRTKLTAGNLLIALPALLDAVKNTIATDVPSQRLPELAQAIQDADMSQLSRIVLQPPEYMTADPNSSAGYILIPDLAAIRAIGEELLADPAARPTPEAGEPDAG